MQRGKTVNTHAEHALSLCKHAIM